MTGRTHATIGLLVATPLAVQATHAPLAEVEVIAVLAAISWVGSLGSPWLPRKMVSGAFGLLVLAAGFTAWQDNRMPVCLGLMALGALAGLAPDLDCHGSRGSTWLRWLVTLPLCVTGVAVAYLGGSWALLALGVAIAAIHEQMIKSGHRGPLHSLLMAVLFGAAVRWAVGVWLPAFSWAAGLTVGLSYLAHLLADVPQSPPMEWFWPIPDLVRLAGRLLNRSWRIPDRYRPLPRFLAVKEQTGLGRFVELATVVGVGFLDFRLLTP